MNESQTEAQVLYELQRELESQGFDVYLNPRTPVKPGFLGAFEPDAVAISEDRKIVIEVSRHGPRTDEKLKKISDLVAGQPGWEFRAVIIKPEPGTRAISVETTEQINNSLDEARILMAASHYRAALLVCWATFEALARNERNSDFARPQTPGRLIQVLASDGTLTPTEADTLRELAEKRNLFVHGGLGVAVTQSDITSFINILVELLKSLPRTAS